MPSNKDRPYAALYARGGNPIMPDKEDTSHWALIVGPNVKVDGGMGVRYHAKERPKLGGGSEGHFEERDCPLAPTNMLLVRIVVGKVADGSRLVEILRSTPIRQGQPGWNCVSWVKEALESLEADGPRDERH
ncbi:hypothetical protein AOCH_006510 [Aspergillus ochraceoroseus]|uniref:Uncharacterized protein n=1 Tax=Aspergillus ochraceoroseus TaxID=138278 RepID=A0A0F8V111_9EURO|nr:hypothetical protein AOCH_006510 [Aspergillus ochraceoroseus]